MSPKQNMTLQYTRDIPKTKGLRRAKVSRMTKRLTQECS